MAEVFDLLGDKREAGLLINIELKNNVYYYVGMEEKIVGLAARKGWEANIVYSSFYTRSVVKIRELLPSAKVAVLDTMASNCLYKAKGIGDVDALHPYWQGMDLPKEELKGYTVRAWFGGHLFPERPTGTKLDLSALEAKGITDVMLNEPEVYL